MIRAAIFDLDGTLLDSNPYWDKAPEAYLASVGVTAEPGIGKTIFAMTLPEAVEYLRRTYGLSQTGQEITHGVNAMMERFYLREVPVKEGIPALLDALNDRGLAMMVASVTDRSLVETVLRRHGLLERFAGVITTDEVGKGKQEPDIYLQAAERLGCAPGEVLVFEDALHALRTAKKAGFPVVGVFDEASREVWEEIRAVSDWNLPDFSNLDGLLAAMEQ